MAKAATMSAQATPPKTTYHQAASTPLVWYESPVQFDSNIQQTDNGRQSTTLSQMMYARQLPHSISAISYSEQYIPLKIMTHQEFQQPPVTKYFVWITSRDTLVPLAEQYHRFLRLLEITCQALALALLIKNGSLSFEHLGWDSWRLIPPYSTPFTFMWTPKKQCPAHFHQLRIIALDI